MESIFHRLWTGIVGSVAGAAVGLPVVIVLKSLKVPLETAMWAVVATAAVGALLGFALGNRRIGKSPESD